MPTIRVQSTTQRINMDARRRVAIQLREGVAEILKENISGVEALWWPPIDGDSAINVLPYTVDIEYSGQVTAEQQQAILDLVTRLFGEERHVAADTEVGVWIKTPGQFLWAQGAVKKEDYNL